MPEVSVKELMDLSKKIAIVTGGSKGIGAGIALRLAEVGATVVIADTDAKAGAELVTKIQEAGGDADFVRVDVSDEGDVRSMTDYVRKEYGGVDILVNNAGVYPDKTLPDITTKHFEEVIHTNVLGAMLCTKYVGLLMMEKGGGGRIVNITSVNAIHAGDLGLGVYVASKHALWGFTRNVAKELAPHHIWVNAIAPGYIDTPGTAEDMEEDPEKATQEREEYTKQTPMRRSGTPDDIGKVAVFLCSGLSDYMTGSQVVVDGGMMLS